MTSKTVHEMLSSIDELEAEKRNLRRALEGSLALETFMPDAFKHGSCKVGGRSSEAAPHEGTVTFTLGNGEVREMPAMKVPFFLWPKGMREQFMGMRDKHKRVSIEKKLAREGLL